MFNIYVASAIDVCPSKAIKQVEEFSKIFSKYNVNVFGAGYNEDSPIIDEHSTLELKGIISAYDLRIIRECDIFLMITDLDTFCPGTSIEFEYARRMGLYMIVLCLGNKGFVKNIFIETYANKILYSKDELEYILKGVCGEK